MALAEPGGHPALELEPGDRLLLRADARRGKAIRLERDDTGRAKPELAVRACFPGLRVEEGGFVDPPREALRFLPGVSGPLRVEPPMLRRCERVELDVWFIGTRVELSWSRTDARIRVRRPRSKAGQESA